MEPRADTAGDAAAGGTAQQRQSDKATAGEHEAVSPQEPRREGEFGPPLPRRRTSCSDSAPMTPTVAVGDPGQDKRLLRRAGEGPGATGESTPKATTMGGPSAARTDTSSTRGALESSGGRSRAASSANSTSRGMRATPRSATVERGATAAPTAGKRPRAAPATGAASSAPAASTGASKITKRTTSATGPSSQKKQRGAGPEGHREDEQHTGRDREEEAEGGSIAQSRPARGAQVKAAAALQGAAGEEESDEDRPQTWSTRRARLQAAALSTQRPARNAGDVEADPPGIPASEEAGSTSSSTRRQSTDDVVVTDHASTPSSTPTPRLRTPVRPSARTGQNDPTREHPDLRNRRTLYERELP